MVGMELTLTLPQEALDALVTEITGRVLSQLSAATAPDAYLTVEEAAAVMRCTSQRIYDLRSANVLTRHSDGRRALVCRAEIDRYIQSTTAQPALAGGRA